MREAAAKLCHDEAASFAKLAESYHHAKSHSACSDAVVMSRAYERATTKIRALPLTNPVTVSDDKWLPIEQAGEFELILCYAPPENLYTDPKGLEGEVRWTTRRNWTWATHFKRVETLPYPPTTSTAGRG